MRLWRLMIPCAAAMLLAGCVGFGDWGNSDRYKEDFHYSYDLGPGSTVSLENFNGSVEVTGWDENRVEIDGTKYASREELLRALKVDVTPSSNYVSIRTNRPSMFHGNGGVRYSIRVPRKTTLDPITSSNGHIQIDDIDGTVRLRTTNGGVRVDRISGRVDATTSNGRIEAHDVTGDLRVHTTNGAIDAQAQRGQFEAGTTNGSIEAELIQPRKDWPVRVSSTNGHISLDVRATDVPDVRANTSNSSITLRLPADANARVHAHTSHSSVRSDFDGLRPADSRNPHDLDGTLGSGGGYVDLSTSNGSIQIAKL